MYANNFYDIGIVCFQLYVGAEELQILVHLSSLLCLLSEDFNNLHRDSSSYGHGAAAWCYGLYLLSKLHLLLVLLQMFDLFDVKCNGVIEFGEFVQSLGVFHPNAPVEEKIYCKVNISLDCNACRCTCTRPPSHTQTSSFFCMSIWFLLVR